MTAAKPSQWAAKREGTLNQFYTRPEVGELLIRELGDFAPQMVLDLGAGEGSLAASVAKRWPDTHLTTVDIDPACAEGLHESLIEVGATDHEHKVWDVFDPALPSVLRNRQFDLAVCNPPFYRPEWRREFADILHDADFASACSSVAEATAEIIFLAQNLRLVRSGGMIALIVPDGLATSWRHVAFRRALLQQHGVRAAIQLPPYSFMDTEAYCFILIVEKDGGSGTTKLRRLNDDGTYAESIEVDAISAELRLDYGYHEVTRDEVEGGTTLRQLGAEIRRGSLSTVERKALDAFIFHTGDFPIAGGEIALEAALPLTSKRLVIAQPGDILMARVDRELHDKIAFVSQGQAAITDCVYRIRLPQEHRRLAFNALASNQGRTRIRAVTKGVGARLLGKGDLLDLRLAMLSPCAAENID